MPFGLCNAPATFMLYITTIFTDMIEDGLDVFMDDFSMYMDSFTNCLGIFLGFCISKKGLKVD
ncbi:Transposon Ty3-I Gag-Pol polyprotein [Gossypium australe]|uniref:Transposon Ty3-I Gag-Pol polyprotein n=1 Tax=Gossypium australe TaxID=47621 RepID=A0A5B6VM25_9ROSI|nr:Transposon Ty3-I Gag-Pol polyprotein [Gossypium australe]